MLNEQTNHRATIFINESRMMNNQDLGILNPVMQELSLMPSANKQMTFQITPNGLQPIEGLSIDLRAVDDSFKIAFGQGRFDIIRSKVRQDDNLESLNDFIVKVQHIVSLLRKVYPSWSFNRLALCISVCFDLDEEHLSSSYHKFVTNDEPNIVEWRLRKVVRKPLCKDNDLLVNQVVTISRSISQISFEQIPRDRVLIETDFNTVVGQNIDFNPEMVSLVWDNMVSDTLQLINKYNQLLTE